VVAFHQQIFAVEADPGGQGTARMVRREADAALRAATALSAGAPALA